MSAVDRFRSPAAKLLALIAFSAFLSGFTFEPDTPENQGMSSDGLAALETYSDAFSANTGLAVLRNDRLVLERYRGTGNPNKRWALKSATKAFGAGLLVRALDDGVLALDDLACNRPDVTIHDVVSMTAGIPKGSGEDCDSSLLFAPGTDFAYSDGSANVFRDKLRELYGADLAPLMASAIMDPIGVERWSWKSAQNLSSDLSTTLRDMIRYGRLWLRGGDWDGVPVLSQSGVDLATAVSNPQLKEDFGYMWWVRGESEPAFYDRYGFKLAAVFPPEAPADAFLTAGCNRAYILVVPSLNLVAARGGGKCVSIQNGNTQFTDEVRGFVEAVLASVSACSDGIDNDGNGLVDYPEDPGCTDLADTSEGAPVDQPPVADAGPDQAVNDGDLVVLDGSGSFDSEGAIASYLWEQQSGPAVALSGAGSATPSFVAPDPGISAILTFQLTVTDGLGQTATDAVQIDVWGSAASFADGFGTDTTNSYTVTQTSPSRGTAQLVYDAAGQRAQVLTGNDYGLILARDVPPRTSGAFSLDFLPTVKYPKGGIFAVRLVQDADNYYELRNTDGYGAGEFSKVVGGQVVDTVGLASDYSQGINYTVILDFQPGAASADAFGALHLIDQDATSLTISRVEVELYQQDAYLDNFFYGVGIDWPPVADAGPDQVASAGDLVVLDGSGSFDPEGAIASYLWEQQSGPAVGLSDPGSATPSFVAPDPGTSASLIFQLTVTDDIGQTATDAVQIDVWGNQPPVADAGPDQVVNDGDLVVLDGSGSFDPEGAIASYLWEQQSGPAVGLSDTGSATPSFVAPDPGTSASLIFQLTVTDDIGQTATDAVQIDVWGSAASFADSFGTDTTGSYTVTQTTPDRGTAQLVYDAAGQRAQVLMGDNYGLILARDVPPRTSGTFSLDFLPTTKYPKGGIFTLRLVQDADNYYELRNTDGYGAGELSKVVGGQVVDTVGLANDYSQGVNYTVILDFQPGAATVDAFGAIHAIDQDATSLTISSVEVELYQQDAYLDNFFYGSGIDRPPLADAGPDQVVSAGDLVVLDGSGSFDSEGAIASYLWEQQSGPAVGLSDPGSATPSFVAPDPGSSASLIFQLTVTDDIGQTATDVVQIDVWGSASSFVDSFDTDTTGTYLVTQTTPDRGTAQLVYDAAGQRAQVLMGDNYGLIVAQDVFPRTSGTFSVDFLPMVKYPKGGIFTLRLIQDADNYYELRNTDGYGAGELSKVVGGQVVDTVSLASDYSQGVNYTIVIDFRPEMVTADAFGAIHAIDQDATSLLVSSVELEAYQQDAYFDDLSLTDLVARDPLVILTVPYSGVLLSGMDLLAEASGYYLDPTWGVRFTVNAGSPSELSADDYTRPFSADFLGVGKGTFTVDVEAIDAAGAPMPGASAQAVNVGIGDGYVGVGDSITEGYGDNVDFDDVSADLRNVGGGYEPILNDLLTAYLGYPHTVENEGIGGTRAASGASRIDGILSSYPEAVFFLVMYGTNDSADLLTPSGLGLGPGDAGYAGSYKADMQAIIDPILQAGMVPILARVPIAYGACSRCDPYPDPASEPRNALIREYNQVLLELEAANGLLVQGPDFYSYFEQHPEEMRDKLHPNGVGYQSMADLWLQALTGP